MERRKGVMDKYNISSSSNVDFDHLDIEGRSKEDDRRVGKESLAEEHKRLLDIKVRLEGDDYGYVFSVTKREGTFRWRCHLCDVVIIGQTHVETHIQSKKHQVKMAVPLHDRQLFTRIMGEEAEAVEVNCGEPAPPGFDDVAVKKKGVAQIQAILDCYKASPLIGLEYLIEIVPDERDKEPMYICVLCDKKGDPRVAMAHLTSFNHRSKYIGINFPTANRAINSALPRTKEGRKGVTDLVTKICFKIEEKHGRLHPLVLQRDMYERRKDYYHKQIEADRHFRESAEENYMDLVDEEAIRPYNINLDEVPLPEVDEPVPKKDDSKRKITVDRSRLRTHATKENDKKNKSDADSSSDVKYSSSPEKSKSGTQRRNSLSSISNISSSSLSRSPSPVRIRSKSRTPSSSPPLSLHRRRSHSRSRDRGQRKYMSRDRDRDRDRYRRRSRSRSRSRGHGSSYYRRSPRRSPPKAKVNSVSAEKLRWEKFRLEKDKIEMALVKTLKFHEKNPEKHPMYPEEWKKFWNIRYKELQAEGKDPSTHDFKPEWINFWNKRMKEMHEEELKEKKEVLREKLNLPKEDPHPLVVKRIQRKPPVHDYDDDVIVVSPNPITDKISLKRIRTAGTDRNRSPSPWDKDDIYPPKNPRKWASPRSTYVEPSRVRAKPVESIAPHYIDEPAESARVITVIRLLTAMESQLGSIGPTVNNLLATALAMEKTRTGASEALLGNPDNLVLFETIKEKLKGQLFAGIVEPCMVMATRASIQNIAQMLYRAEKMPNIATVAPLPSTVVSSAPVVPPVVSAPLVAKVAQPVTVPGVGAMDKAAIAVQIAAALVAEGRGNVTQEELECLINAVVGMAQQSANLEKPITTAAFVSQMQGSAASSATTAPVPTPAPVPAAEPVEEKSSLQKLMSVIQAKPPAEESPKPDLNHLFPSTRITTEQAKKEPPPCKNITDMDDLTEADLKNLLQSFKDLPTDEQHCLIVYLKKIEETDPDRVENLRQFVNLPPSQRAAPQSAQLAPAPVPAPTQPLTKSALQKQGKKSSFRRLSPFSLRMGRSNPMQDESFNEFEEEEEEEQEEKEVKEKVEDKIQSKPIRLEDDSDDDYSFEDIYEAASKKVIEKETAAKVAQDMVAKEKEEATKKQMLDKLLAELTDVLPVTMSASKTNDTMTIMNETSQAIANLMNQLPARFKRTPTPTVAKTDTPIKVELPERPFVGLKLDIHKNLPETNTTQNINLQIDPSPVRSQISVDHLSNSNSNTIDGPVTPIPNLYDSVIPANNMGFSSGYDGSNNGYDGQYAQQSFNNAQYQGVNPNVDNRQSYQTYSNTDYGQGFQGNYAVNYDQNYYSMPGQQGENMHQHGNFQQTNFQQPNLQQQNPHFPHQQMQQRPMGSIPNYPQMRGNAPQGYPNVYGGNQFNQYGNQQQRFY